MKKFLVQVFLLLSVFASAQNKITIRGGGGSPGSATAQLLSVTDFGAVGDGTTDNTTAFQNAVNSLNGIGGTVNVPSGAFKIAGTFTIPANVTLRGTYTGALSHTQEYDGFWGAGHDLPIVSGKPSGGGSTLLITGGSGNASATPTITLKTNSSIEGFSFYYPNQVAKTSGSPTPYPFAIHSLHTNNINIKNIEFINAYQAIWMEYSHRGIVRDITGQPLFMGLKLAGGGDVNRLQNIHFGALFTYGTPLFDYVASNATAFQIGREDLLHMSDCFAYGYGKGVHFIQTSGYSPDGFGGMGGPNKPWAELEKCSFDVCVNNILVEAGQWAPISFVGGHFTNNSSASPLTVTSTFTGKISFTGSFFHSAVAKYVSIEGNGLVKLDNCIFDNNGSSSTNTAIVADGSGSVQVTNSTFATVQPQVSFAPTLSRAIFTNNVVAGALNITNSLSAGYVIGNNVDATAAVGGGGEPSTGFPLGTETIYDNFNGSAANLTTHTADAGGAYSKVWSMTGDLSIAGGGVMKYNGPGETDATYKIANALPSADQTATIELVLSGTAGTQQDDIAGIYIRANTSASARTGYEARLDNGNGGTKLQLVAWNNGTATMLYNVTTTAFAGGVTNKITVSAVGSTITLKLNDTTVFSETDTTVAGGSSERNVVLSGYSSDGTSVILVKAIASF